MFGTLEDGPLRRSMHARQWSRVLEFLEGCAGDSVLEVGCGGAPERRLLDRFDSYTGMDFSRVGLDAAASHLTDVAARARFVEAAAVDLPLEDESFAAG